MEREDTRWLEEVSGVLLVWREKTPGGWRRFLVCYWCGERRYQVAGGGFWCVTGVEREDTKWLEEVSGVLLVWREKTPAGWRRFLVCYWCGERRHQVIGGGFWCVTGVEREDTRWLEEVSGELLVWREKIPSGWRRFLVCYWCGERRHQVIGGGFWCVTGVEREDTSWLEEVSGVLLVWREKTPGDWRRFLVCYWCGERRHQLAGGGFWCVTGVEREDTKWLEEVSGVLLVWGEKIPSGWRRFLVCYWCGERRYQVAGGGFWCVTGVEREDTRWLEEVSGVEREDTRWLEEVSGVLLVWREKIPGGWRRFLVCYWCGERRYQVAGGGFLCVTGVEREDTRWLEEVSCVLLVWREKTPGGWRRFLVCYWCGERRHQVAGGGFWCVTGVEREDTRWL